ncbi:MAG: delta-60 repeat domain-containing protein, partial [Bacteroidota bacterium]
VISDIAVQADGKIIIAGNFTSFNGTTRNNIARINADGSIDNTFNPGSATTFGIQTITLQNDGKILIAGNFTSFSGTAANRLIRLNADGSIDNTFNTGTGIPSGAVFKINIQSDGKILIAGFFPSYNGNTAKNITRLNQDGTFDNTFQPGTGTSASIYAMFIQADERIVIGGLFNSYNNIGRNRIARILKCQPDILTLTSASVTDNQSVCSGLPITNITYTAGGGATGARVNGLPTGITGTFNNGTFTISGSSTAAGSYDYVVSTTGGCSISTTGKIIIHPVPQINVNSPSVCAGDSATLSVSGTANSFTWSPTTGLRPTTGATIKASPSITTTYTVTATFTTTGCQNTAPGTVTIKTSPTKPTININGNQLVSSSSIGNQWYLNGGALTGQTAQTITPTQSGP